MKNNPWAFLALYMLLPALVIANIPELYNSLRVVPENTFNWYENSKEIEEIFNKNDIRIVIEIGSWVGGGSTRHMGNLLREKQGKLYAVDTWLGNPAQQIGKERYDPVLSYVYQQFLSNMIHWDLVDVVIPVRMRSTEAARALNVQPNLVYIDGEHSFESVYEDLSTWYPFVKNQGILCGDDWQTWSSVRMAVEKFASENDLKIVSSGNFWRLIQK